MRLWLVVVLLMCLAGCGDAHSSAPTPSTSVPPTTMSADARRALDAVAVQTALGDSVPYGTACACTPYPQLTGTEAAYAVAHPVDTANDAVPGYLSGDVVNQLHDDSDAIAHVRKSDVIMVEVGANDVAYTSACGTAVACYEPKLPEVTSNINAIVARVHALTTGRPIAVVLLDYWNVWLGGQYAQAKGPAYVEAADFLTAQVDDTIRSIAHASGSIYVDLRVAFRGPDHDADETELLSPDGDHPNAAGHERIADAVALAVQRR